MTESVGGVSLVAGRDAPRRSDVCLASHEGGDKSAIQAAVGRPF